jgi:hypothetical protein
MIVMRVEAALRMMHEGLLQGSSMDSICRL